MRIPVNFLLYTASLGMLGLAGKLFVEATPALQGVPVKDFADRGMSDASKLVQRGKGLGGQDLQYPYHQEVWWRRFKEVNWIGKEEKVEIEQPVDPVETQATALEETPLSEVLELIHLMYDSKDTETHVVVRYRPEANIEIPEELARSLARAASGPADLARGPGGVRPGGRPAGGADTNGNGKRGNQRGPQSGVSPMPRYGAASSEIVHFVAVGETLWEPFAHVRLQRVEEDCESAYFTRQLPDGEESKPEEVFKTTMDLSPELTEAIIETRRGQRAQAAAQNRKPAGGNGGGSWVNVTETQLIDGRRHIGSDDAQMFAGGSEDLLDSVNVETYTPRFGGKSMRGLVVRNVDPKLAQRYGIAQNDVILKLNGQSVTTKAGAINLGRKLYRTGVRTFTVTVMSQGRIEDRIYVAPDE